MEGRDGESRPIVKGLGLADNCRDGIHIGR